MAAHYSRTKSGYFPEHTSSFAACLQEGTRDRVGGSETISVDVRVICATHRNLEKMVAEGAFRMDLYYRLRGLTIDLPPLRDRKRDIPALTQHFLRKNQGEIGAIGISPSAMASLIQHTWPGNVRELENVIRSAALFADSDEIHLNDLLQQVMFSRRLFRCFRPSGEPAGHDDLDQPSPQLSSNVNVIPFSSTDAVPSRQAPQMIWLSRQPHRI